jgi:hypothetical protein
MSYYFFLGVLRSVYFLPFSASYHLPFISAVTLCLFLFFVCRCQSLQLLTSVIFTWIVTFLWYHVVLHWFYKIILYAPVSLM